MPVGYLNSSDLISTVKREALIPTNQNLFTNNDFLAMANQELRISVVPQVLTSHEEYFVRDSDPIPLVANISNYQIPYRAVGSKFRAVFYLDTNGNLRSMTRISPDDRPYYQLSNFQNRFVYFFLQGNDVVIVPTVDSNPQGYLVFSYYMRPNELVDVSRVSTILNISLNGTTNILTIPTTGDISSGSAILSNVAVINNVAVGQLITGTGIAPNTLVVGISGSTVTMSNPATLISTGTLITFSSTTSFTVDNIPTTATTTQLGNNVTGFTNSTYLDMCQTNPGHRILTFDKVPVQVDTINKVITFITSDVSPLLVLGDYISYAGECIIPNIPSDLHDVLAQRVVTRCLLALGDQAGYQAATQKLGDMQQNASYLISNRSEAEPQKINNLKGLIRGAKLRKRGWI